jgi:FAD/FMN-containing dehydrogenase
VARGDRRRRAARAGPAQRLVVAGRADGEVRHVDADHHADLFWAVRDGKGDFGIVTDIEFDLMPVARFYGGAVFFPAASTADVLHAWREWAPSLPEDTTTSVALLRLPPDPALPEPVRGQFVVSLGFAHLGTVEEGAALLAPMRALATPLMDLVDEKPYAAVDAVHMDPTAPMPISTNIVIG